MKDLRARWVFTGGILYLLPEKGEVHNSRVRCGWGQIRFWLPFAVFWTYTIDPDWYRVYST